MKRRRFVRWKNFFGFFAARRHAARDAPFVLGTCSLAGGTSYSRRPLVE